MDRRNNPHAILGIDIGGSAFKAHVVDTSTGKAGREFKVKIKSPLSLADGMKAANKIVRHFDWRGRPVGIGFPGIVLGARLGSVGNLGKQWEGKPAAALFAKATGCPTHLCNDADAAGMAEMQFGAGRGQSGTVLMLTFGTGIGSALFRDGRLMPNIEFGHIPWCHCRYGGHDLYDPIERFASARVKTEQGLDWAQWTPRVNLFLHIVDRLCSPDLIIVGGGVSEDWQQWRHLVESRAKVVPAELGNTAGAIGAAYAASQALH